MNNREANSRARTLSFVNIGAFVSNFKYKQQYSKQEWTDLSICKIMFTRLFEVFFKDF